MSQRITTPEDINSIESESGIIATLINNPNYSFFSEYLLPNHFSSLENRYIYQAICSLAKKGITSIDAYNIIEMLKSSEATQKALDIVTVERLQEFIEISSMIARNTIEEYKLLVSNVMNAAFRRDMYRSLNSCIKLCTSPEGGEDLKKEIYRRIDEQISAYSTVDEVPAFADVVDKMWGEIQRRQGCGYSGIPFKFPALNDYVTGERGELIIFGAQQKVGKSIMLLNIAVDLLRQGYSVLYIDSELSTRLFTARMLAHLTGISYRNLTAGQYPPEDAEKINAAMDWIKTRKFTHIYMPFFDKDTIYSTTKTVNHRQDIDVVIIDYFKATGDELDAYQTYAAMGKCVDLVKNEIAGDMNIVAIGAAQATINNKLADSAKIARNASTIIMLLDKTPEEIERDGQECGNKKMIVTVNRNGAQMSAGEYIDLRFDGDHILYEQAQQHIPQTPF